MKNILKFVVFFLIIGCKSSRSDYKLTFYNPKKVESNILIIENLLKKIPSAPHYEKIFPQYDLNKGQIYISFSSINYRENDSIIEGRFNPNIQRIDTIKHVNGLLDNQLSKLKESFYFLEKEGIIGNEYFMNEFINKDQDNKILESCNFPFFVYPYKSKEWKPEDIEDTKYIVVLSRKESNSDCFTKNYKILDKKGNIYLIQKIR